MYKIKIGDMTYGPHKYDIVKINDDGLKWIKNEGLKYRNINGKSTKIDYGGIFKIGECDDHSFPFHYIDERLEAKIDEERVFLENDEGNQIVIPIRYLQLVESFSYSLGKERIIIVMGDGTSKIIQSNIFGNLRIVQYVEDASRIDNGILNEKIYNLIKR